MRNAVGLISMDVVVEISFIVVYECACDYVRPAVECQLWCDRKVIKPNITYLIRFGKNMLNQRTTSTLFKLH